MQQQHRSATITMAPAPIQRRPAASGRVPGRRALWLGIVVLLALAGSNRAVISAADAPAARASSPARQPAGGASRPAPVDRTTAEFKTFALNALLAPLIDDDAPARWADPSLTVDCVDAAVTVDGARPDVGAPMATEFTVRWSMDRCHPLGAPLALSGSVELVVRRDGAVYSAVVRPENLRLSSPLGHDVLTEPFTALLRDGS